MRLSSKYYAGDKVYYRTNTTEWKGPGVVIGQYQKLVLVKTGGLFVRVHPSKLILQAQADKDLNTDTTIQDPGKDQNMLTERQQLDNETSSDSEEDAEETLQVSRRQEGVSETPDTMAEGQTVTNRQGEVTDHGVAGDEVITSNSCPAVTSWTGVEEDNKKGRFVLKTGDEIRYKENLDSSFKEAIVLGNAGRVIGVNKNR